MFIGKNIYLRILNFSDPLLTPTPPLFCKFHNVDIFNPSNIQSSIMLGWSHKKSGYQYSSSQFKLNYWQSITAPLIIFVITSIIYGSNFSGRILCKKVVIKFLSLSLYCLKTIRYRKHKVASLDQAL